MTSTGMANACEAAGGKCAGITRLLGISAAALSRWHEFALRAIELEEKILGKIARVPFGSTNHFGVADNA